MKENVKKINEILDSYGDIAIQVRETGRGTLWGYAPAYVFAAVREGGGEIRGVRIVEHYQRLEERSWHAWAIVETTIWFPGDREFVLQHAGESRSPASEGEALKGAITNAIEKALSVLGIGERAYMGLLGRENSEDLAEKSEISDKVALGKATEKQLNLINALRRTIRQHPELIERYANELKGFREQLERGMTKAEAGQFIDWCRERGIEPTWPTWEDKNE